MRSHLSALAALLLLLFLCTPPVFSFSLTTEENLIHDNDLQIDWMRDGAWLQAPMTWKNAGEWLVNLNLNGYGGYHDWRLPDTPNASALGYKNTEIYNVTTSELGHLFYTELGLKGKIDPDMQMNTTFGLGQTPTPFRGLQSGLYWFGTQSPTILDPLPTAWAFDFAFGSQFLQTTNTKAYVIAVRSSAPTPAPEPASSLLFLSGITATIWYLRKKNRIPLQQNFLTTTAS